MYEIYRQTDRGRIEVLRWGSLTLAPIIDVKNIRSCYYVL